MAFKITAEETIRAWLRDTLAASGMSASEWAQKAGISRATIYRALNPDIRLTMSLRSLVQLAEAAGVEPPGVPPGNLAPRIVQLPIVHLVAAGAWRVTEEWDEPIGYAPVEYIEHYAGFKQWCEQVVGDSYNRLIPDGSIVHVVDAVELGYAPRHGDTVIAVRSRMQGALNERSLKQVEIDNKGNVQLWPRSYNPMWFEPISLTDGTRPDDEVEVYIAAKVLRSYQRFD